VDILNNIQTIPTPIFYLAGRRTFRFVQETFIGASGAIVGGIFYTAVDRVVAEDSAPGSDGAVVGGFAAQPLYEAVAEDSAPGSAGAILGGQIVGAFQRNATETATGSAGAIVGGFVFTVHFEAGADEAGSTGVIVGGVV
jgi:hypothetical protein